MLTPRNICLFAGAALSAVPALAADCDFNALHEDAATAAGVELIEIEASAGDLKVIGEEGSGLIRVHGEACASKQRLLEDVRLLVERHGANVRIVAETPDSGWRRSSARLDLTIVVPTSVEIEIDDGPGAIEVSDVAAVQIDDHAGAIEVENVAGDLWINDGLGAIEASGIGGEVWIDDGLGKIVLYDAGSVVIEDDTWGAIYIEDVVGDVLVDFDLAGSIDVHGVGGDLTVDFAGSNEIFHSDVAGEVDVPEEDFDVLEADSDC